MWGLEFLNLCGLNLGKKNLTVIGGFYRHPNTSIPQFTEYFSESLDKLKNVKHCYVFGDFNVCLSNYSSSPLVTSFLDSILDSKFLPFVFMPTRLTSHSATILDHFYSNDAFSLNQECKTGLVTNCIADHCANFFFLTNTALNRQDIPIYQTFRNFSKSNTTKFHASLMLHDWSSVKSYSDPNSALDYFLQQFSNMHNASFPFITVKNKDRRDKKWITPDLIKQINHKCKFYKKWIKSRKKTDEDRYKNHAKKLRANLAAAEKQFYMTQFDTKKCNSKMIWRNINSLIGTAKQRTTNIPVIIKDGVPIENVSLISNSFNKYFAEVGISLANTVSSSVAAVHFESFLNPFNQHSFRCDHVTLPELLNVVSSLKASRSVVNDCFSSALLKDCVSFISDPLLYIFNASFDSGIFPNSLKHSRVIPVFKKGSKSEMSNYRPISITNPLAKVLEKLMHVRMTSFINKFHLLYDFQYGFRSNFSTSLAVLDVTNMIQNETYQGNFIMGVFMDLQKAFDTINFEILFKKLYHYGFRGHCLDWLRSYLTGRTQFTALNGVSSGPLEITCGVPQGTVLGPLLFLIYINDIPNSVKNSVIKLFADDSNLFIVSKDLSTLFSVANSELAHISSWTLSNKLHINYTKTNYMLFYPKLISPSMPQLNLPSLSMNGHIIERVHVFKYLGVLIDDVLSWRDHLNHVASKISSLIGILSRNKSCLPSKCRKDIYFALIHSTLIYCIESYGNVSKSASHQILIKNNRLLRLLQFKSRRTPLKELYSSFNTLPIHLLYEYYSMKLVHKCLYDSPCIPSVVRGWFTRGSSIHDHNTRQSSSFALISLFNPNSIQFLGPSNWSKLPAYLQNDPSLRSFLSSFKQYLLASF